VLLASGWVVEGDLESDAQPPQDRSSVAGTATAAAAAANDNFKLVVFKIGNSDFASWAWVQDFDSCG
jgi:hypothetical protein